MSHVKKIGDIINSFITGESVNRKRPRDEVGEKEAKRSKSSHSLDKTAFMSRVSSYNCPGWGGRKVGPLLLARHGWEALQDQQLMVRCTSCQENLYLKLPPPTSGVYQKCLEIQCERVVSAHSKFCPWSTTPCPPTYAGVDTDLDSIKKRAEILVKLGTKLPCLLPEMVEPWRPVLQHFSVVPDKSDSDVMGVSAVLALCGWRAGEQEDVLEDLYGTRHVGLWNFVSLLEEEDRRETQRIMREFSEPIGEKGEREVVAVEDRVEGAADQSNKEVVSSKDDTKRTENEHDEINYQEKGCKEKETEVKCDDKEVQEKVNQGEDPSQEEDRSERVDKTKANQDETSDHEEECKDEEASNNSNGDEGKEVVDEDSLPNKSLNKPYFHPQTEHMSWNPILTEEGGQLGWQIVLDTLNKNHGVEKQLTSPNRHRQPLASLQRVRSLLNQW